MWFTSTSFTTGTIFGIESVLTMVSTLFIYLNFVCHLVIYKVSPFCHLSILSLIYILSILVSCIYSFFTTSTGTSTQRPLYVEDDFLYYDTTLKKYIRWNGEEWTNTDGSSLGEQPTQDESL